MSNSIIHDKKGLIEAELTYKKSANGFDYKTSLKQWLSGEMEFSKIEQARFSDKMVLATVAFDKDHTIYIVVPEDIFKEE